MNENLNPQLIAKAPLSLTVSDTTNSHQETAVPPFADWLDPEVAQTLWWTPQFSQEDPHYPDTPEVRKRQHGRG